MESIDLERVAQAAEGAADRARAEILPRFRRVSVEHKSDGSPVTEADRAAERAIREHLRSCFPEFGLLGEEYGGDGSIEGPHWIIDPIDGTIGFSRGIALFSTLISLAIDGGYLAQPERKTAVRLRRLRVDDANCPLLPSSKSYHLKPS